MSFDDLSKYLIGIVLLIIYYFFKAYDDIMEKLREWFKWD